MQEQNVWMEAKGDFCPGHPLKGEDLLLAPPACNFAPIVSTFLRREPDRVTWLCCNFHCKRCHCLHTRDVFQSFCIYAEKV